MDWCQKVEAKSQKERSQKRWKKVEKSEEKRKETKEELRDSAEGKTWEKEEIEKDPSSSRREDRAKDGLKGLIGISLMFMIYAETQWNLIQLKRYNFQYICQRFQS